MTTTTNWFWRNAKYLLICLIALVLVVVMIVLYVFNKKKQAEDLQRQLAIAKANADIEYLKGKAANLTDQTVEVQTKKAALEQEIKNLQKKEAPLQSLDRFARSQPSRRVSGTERFPSTSRGDPHIR